MSASRATATQNLIKAAAAAPRCQHVRINGQHCAAPARTGSNWCMFHYGDYEGAAFPTTGVPEDAASIQLEVGRVIRQLQSQTIETKSAALILYGLQVASMNLRRLGNEMPIAPEVEEETRPLAAEGLGYRIFSHLNAPPELADETFSRCVDLVRFVRGETPVTEAADNK
ncbi:MAG: hypothetical protein M3P27_07980 [Acidobacteriota bacterium]|nr:hypothetical protein [Acidobacteriota bacterium]